MSKKIHGEVMDITASKWEILQIIAHRPSAPLEIAKTLKTTIANVSQQLRLLEAAGLVTRKKIPNSQAGKPRALFSITKEFCDITIVTKENAQRKQIDLTPIQAFISKTLIQGEPGIALAKWFLLQEEPPKTLYLKSINGQHISIEATPGPKTPIVETIALQGKQYTISIEFVQQPSTQEKLYSR